MTLTVTKNGRWRLVGTPDKFADFAGFPDYGDLLDLKSALASIMEGTTARFKDHKGWWELKGSRADLARIIGYPEAKTVVETLEAFTEINPNVRVLS